MTLMRPRLRVVHFVWRLSTTGGIPNVVRNLLRGLDEDDFETHVVSARPALPEDRLGDFPHVGFHHLDVVGALRPADRLRLAAKLARLVPALRPDVVHVHSGTATYAALGTMGSSARLRLLDVHDAPGSARHGPVSDAAEGLLCRRARHLAVAHSSSVSDDLRRLYRLSERAVALVPLGVDASQYQPPEVSPAGWRHAHGIPAAAVLVGYVARLVPSKNVDLFIDVVAEAGRRTSAPIHGVVIAGGSERDRLSARLQHEGLADRILLLGPWTGNQLLEAYAALDVFLSTSDYEGFGLGVVEAMAAGKPVIATAVGGVTDLVEDGVTGLLAERRDREALVIALRRLLDDPELAPVMGAAGRARALERFTVSRMVRGYAELYERAR